MMAEYVELVLFEQSLAGMNCPFFDRVGDVAEKTDGSLLLDIRIEGDIRIQRMAAIGYRANGTVAIMMDKNGQLSSAPVWRRRSSRCRTYSVVFAADDRKGLR